MKINNDEKTFGSALKAAAERDKLRLHTPGHKGKLAPLDLTELTDDSFPGEALRAAQRFAADTYGAKHARYLCGGSSQGVKSAVFYAGGDVIADVNSHRSVFDGCTLSGHNAVTVGERGGIKPITVRDIQSAITRDVRAVVVTTPTYYGYAADVQGIKEFCTRHGLLFIADGAHGAHFGFGELLPPNVAAYADICNLSTHKTLSSLTQSAVMLDNLDDKESDRLFEVADVMGSTSPSYLLYASIDYAVRKAATDETRKAYALLHDAVADIKNKYPFLQNDDFTRLVLDCAALGVPSHKLNALLCASGVYSERVDEKRIVFILTAENTQADVAALDAALYKTVRELR